MKTQSEKMNSNSKNQYKTANNPAPTLEAGATGGKKENQNEKKTYKND